MWRAWWALKNIIFSSLLPLPFTLLASPISPSSRNQPHKAESSETVHCNFPDSCNAEPVWNLADQLPHPYQVLTRTGRQAQHATWNRQASLPVFGQEPKYILTIHPYLSRPITPSPHGILCLLYMKINKKVEWIACPYICALNKMRILYTVLTAFFFSSSPLLLFNYNV